MTVEIRRNPDGSIDEVVAPEAFIHLEQMDHDAWHLVIEDDGDRVDLSLAAFAKPLRLKVIQQ